MAPLRVLVLLALATLAAAAGAADFRIQSDVFIGDAKTMVRENLTLFQGDRVYDFMIDPPQSTVFQPRDSKFTLLDGERRLRTEISTEKISTFIEQLRVQALRSENPLLKFLGQPKFRETLADDGKRLSLASEWLVYDMGLIEAHSPRENEQYREFSDWFARLNTLCNPASLPPFARLQANAALARAEALPSDVHLTVVTQLEPQRKEVTYHSRHQVGWRLLPDDLSRISATNADMEAYRLVKFEEFYGGGESQARRK